MKLNLLSCSVEQRNDFRFGTGDTIQQARAMEMSDASGADDGADASAHLEEELE